MKAKPRERPVFPSNTMLHFSRGPNLENSFSSSFSVVYRLSPKTPRHVDLSGASRLPTCLRRFDIGERLWDRPLRPGDRRLDPASRLGERDLDLDREYLLEYLGDLDLDRE